MDVYPSHIAETLGFEAIRSRIVAHTASEPGSEAARVIAPLEFAASQTELETVAAVQAALEGEASVPEALFSDVSSHLAEVRPMGAYLDPVALLEIRDLVRTTGAVHRFLAEAGLSDRAASLTPIPNLIRSIEGVLEEDGSVLDRASDELRRIRRRLRAAHGNVRKSLLAALRKASSEGWAVEEQPTVRSGRMVIPIRSEAKRKLGGIVHDHSSSGQTAFVEPAECVELNNDVRGLEAEERREIVRLLTALSEHVRLRADEIAANQAFLVSFDLWRAKASVSRQLEGRLPERAQEGIIRLDRARNPELLLASLEAEGREVVPLSLRLGDTYNMVVISGPNAGGKSVAMKTVGLLVYMLACGIPVPVGEETRIDRFDLVMGDIGDEQSIEDDLSTFSSRLERTRHMLTAADARTLVLIDEAGTGTDPAEGAALAQAALEAILAADARAVVTTHHAALKRFAHEAPKATNAMMRFDQESLRPVYAYEEGVPGASYAFEIAKRMGLSQAVVERGRDLVGSDQVSMERLLSDLQSRNATLEEQAKLQEAEVRKASSQRKVLEARLESLTQARDQIRGRALEEADQILGKANAEVERAIREIRESQADKSAVKQVRSRLEETKSTVGREKRKSGRRKQGRSKIKKPSGPVAVGDHVRVGAEGPDGEVISIKGKEAVVAVGPAHTRVKKDRLIKIGGPRPQKVSVKARVAPTVAQIRIDVRGKRALEAIGQVERFVDEALSAGLERAEILHGKGTGALRTTIHGYLEKRHDVVGFDEAPIEQGGAGVTIVSL